MKKNEHKSRTFVADFETTVYKGQAHTEVWAAAMVEMFSEDVSIYHSLPEFFQALIDLDCNIDIYFHNLKFDGGFWLPFLMQDMRYKQAVNLTDEEINALQENEIADIHFLPDKEMKNNTFKYIISDMGEWYMIVIKVKKHFITIKDSLKLLPFSVKKIGEGFKTKHRKIELESGYTGFRYAGCEITEQDKEYISNDVLVVKEALEIMFSEGHDRLTIGSCCLAEYKSFWYDAKAYYNTFPDLTKIPVDENIYGAKNADQYIRKSYKGGWCYVVPQKRCRIINNGLTADVNSLYPSMMHSDSGNYYPVGFPTFWKGNYIPVCCQLKDQYYYFVRIRCEFDIKPNFLPCIQVKGDFNYPPNAWLLTSKIFDANSCRFYEYYIDKNGEYHDTSLILTLTMTDYELIQEHYDLKNVEILDGCFFRAQKGIFDDYIEKYQKIKMNSSGAIREISKLFLNNLYGKMAASDESNFKFAVVKEDQTIGFIPVLANEKRPGYIAAGSAITSYARNFTIRAAQKNYYGPYKPGFIYADTDSIHCDLPPDKLQGITVDDKKFLCWKLEASWNSAWFVRQKTYIEHVVAENLKPINSAYYNVKCAGMDDICKDLFIKSLEGYKPTEEDKTKYTPEQIAFLQTKRTYKDFNVGLQIYGKKVPKRIRGGIVLIDDYYTMR